MSTKKIAEQFLSNTRSDQEHIGVTQTENISEIVSHHNNEEIVCAVRPSSVDAENAVRILLKYIGEDLSREGLLDTPQRVIQSYKELYSGYNANIADVLDKRFFDISSYRDIVLLRDIEYTSFCEHHILPFYGHVDFAYIPNKYVIGVSKIARLVDAFARRLQIQEKMTAQIADAFQHYLEPQGVAIRVRASHSCMSSRGAKKASSILDTVKYTGIFGSSPDMRKEFWHMLE